MDSWGARKPLLPLITVAHYDPLLRLKLLHFNERPFARGVYVIGQRTNIVQWHLIRPTSNS